MQQQCTRLAGMPRRLARLSTSSRRRAISGTEPMVTDTSRNRWAILALLFAGRVGLGLQFQTIGSVADQLADRLHLDFAEIGSLIGFFMMPGLVLSIPSGLAGRYPSDRGLGGGGPG